MGEAREAGRGKREAGSAKREAKVRREPLPAWRFPLPSLALPSSRFPLPTLLGAHISIAGGTQNAPGRAKAIKATAMQIFTKMANRWAERACADDECIAFRKALAETDVRVTMAHDSYLINLASPDPILRRRSIESFVAELQRCEALGLNILVSHPGNHMGDLESGLRRNADAITEALERVPGRCILAMEATAGSGTSLGGRFEELAKIIEYVPEPHRSRMGVCTDTCHLYAAGYDLGKDFDGVWNRFDDVVGRERLKAMHLNDSKTPFNSRRDRHELIGEGALGPKPFRRIVRDERFATIPKVIETPKLEETKTDRRMLRRLRAYARVTQASGGHGRATISTRARPRRKES